MGSAASGQDELNTALRLELSCPLGTTYIPALSHRTNVPENHIICHLLTKLVNNI